MDILRDKESCSFFKIEEDTRLLLLDMNSFNRKSKQTTIQPFKQLQFTKMLRDDQIISHFLNKMKNPESRQACLKEFETYYFDCQPILDHATLFKLLFGNFKSAESSLQFAESL